MANRGHDDSFLFGEASDPKWTGSLPSLPLKFEMKTGKNGIDQNKELSECDW